MKTLEELNRLRERVRQDIRIRQRRHKVFENGENIKFIVYDED